MANENKAGAIITLDEAIAYTHSFQTRSPEAFKSFFVDIEMINLILNQEGCTGIRIYNGIEPVTNKENRVLVGVDVNGEDMSSGIIVEELSPCPQHCPKASLLIKS